MGSDAVVIIGAGEAGISAARGAREAGWLGRIVIVGNELFLPYERPPLSKEVLTGATLPPPRLFMSHDVMKELEIELRAGPAVKIDRATQAILLANGDQIGYRAAVLTVGACARRLPGTNSWSAEVLYLRSYLDSFRLRSRLERRAKIAVVGGGFIGLEVAAAAITKECSVTVIEAGPRLLTRGVPSFLAGVLERRHRLAGVEIHLNAAVTGSSSIGSRGYFSLADGRRIDFDTAVAGIGAIPDTVLAEDCGLEVANGIVVDQFMRTSDLLIFAAGDCCCLPHPFDATRRMRLESSTNAQEQGAVAGRNAVLDVPVAWPIVPRVWSDQYEMTYRSVGVTDLNMASIVRRFGPDDALMFQLSNGVVSSASSLGSIPIVGREMQVASRLVEQKIAADPAHLSDPSYPLKSYLRT